MKSYGHFYLRAQSAYGWQFRFRKGKWRCVIHTPRFEVYLDRFNPPEWAVDTQGVKTVLVAELVKIGLARFVLRKGDPTTERVFLPVGSTALRSNYADQPISMADLQELHAQTRARLLYKTILERRIHVPQVPHPNEIDRLLCIIEDEYRRAGLARPVFPTSVVLRRMMRNTVSNSTAGYTWWITTTSTNTA